MPRLGTPKKRTSRAKKVKQAVTGKSIKSTESSKSAKSTQPDKTEEQGDGIPTDRLEVMLPSEQEVDLAAGPEPEPETPPTQTVDLHDKLVVLDLVRGWEISQALTQKDMSMRNIYRHHHYYYNDYYTSKTAQEMLDDAKPMSLGDATTLWQSLLRSSSLGWDGRRGIKKDYKRWTFKHFVRRTSGPAVLTVDARGSEPSQRIMSVQRRLEKLQASANHQWYIRSHGRIAECYFIHNEQANQTDITAEMYWGDASLDTEQQRLRQVYGPRVIDMSSENGKALLDFIFGDVTISRVRSSLDSSGPRHWSMYCKSIIEYPSFEVVLQEKRLSKYLVNKQAREKAYEEELRAMEEELVDKADNPSVPIDTGGLVSEEPAEGVKAGSEQAYTPCEEVGTAQENRSATLESSELSSEDDDDDDDAA